MASIRKKYPCGYEIEVSDWNRGLIYLEEKYAPEDCPLHGRSCIDGKEDV